MFTDDERKALASLERSERFRERARWPLLVLSVGVMALAAYIYFLNLRLLPAKGESATADMFWPTFFIAAGVWIVGLYAFVKAITWWRRAPSIVLLLALTRESQTKHEATVQENPETQSAEAARPRVASGDPSLRSG